MKMIFNSVFLRNRKSFSILAVGFLMSVGCVTSNAQRVATVSGKYDYYLGENDNVTIKDAKIKAVELAKAEAIKSEFGVLVASDYINTEVGVNDEFSSYYITDTSASVKGEWLGDEDDPQVTISVGENGDLCFSAIVKGKAREITRATTDIKWKVQKDVGGKKTDADTFNSGERFFVNFKSPSDGYVAIYLITGDDETACLLPYRKDTRGRVSVRGGQEYNFFDKSIDPQASYYKLSTKMEAESNQLVVLYSPNPFTKCTDTSRDPLHPNVLKSKDFAKWLLKAQRADNELVVNRRWVKITAAE